MANTGGEPSAVSTEDIEMGVKAAPAPPWQMPTPSLPFLIWRPNILAKSKTYGILAKDYPNALDINLVVPGSGVLKVYKGVKHISDPSLRNVIAYTADGVWEQCDFETDINAKFAALWGTIRAIMAAGAGPPGQELLKTIAAIQAKAEKTESALKTEIAGMKLAIKKLEEQVK